MTQLETLRLVEWLDLGSDPYDKAAAAELRRLHEVNQELVEALNKILWTRLPNRNPSRYAHTVEEIAFKVLAKHDKARRTE
jgi:hypothetical protein